MIDAVRENSRKLGVAFLLAGVLSLVVLRFWASPVAVDATGRSGVSVLSFLGIPLFLGLVGVGIALFLWGPEQRPA